LATSLDKEATIQHFWSQGSWDMNPSPTTEQKIVKTTHNPASENPGANDDGGGDRHNHGDMLGTTDSAEE
jgi:hypothetical protein